LKTTYLKNNFYGAKRLIHPSPAVKKTLKEIYSLAKTGKVLGIEFGLGAKKKDIIKKWGPPKGTDNNGIWYKRENKRIYFAFDSKVTVKKIQYRENKMRFSVFDTIKVLGVRKWPIDIGQN
jgi:hypothetical protein